MPASPRPISPPTHFGPEGRPARPWARLLTALSVVFAALGCVLVVGAVLAGRAEMAERGLVFLLATIALAGAFLVVVTRRRRH